MFEIEQAAIDEGGFFILFPPDELNAGQENGLHDYIVLKMNVFLGECILSRRMKGIEK